MRELDTVIARIADALGHRDEDTAHDANPAPVLFRGIVEEREETESGT